MQITVVISKNQNNPNCASIENKLEQVCRESGMAVLVTGHLYHMPDDDPAWAEISALQGAVVLVSRLYPRPAEWIFRKHWNGESLTALNAADYDSAEACYAAIAQIAGDSASLPCHQTIKLSDYQTALPPRWYPVIDRSRCINCRNCLQFCLFGVYEEDADGGVMVCKPDSCKHGCPACSRICPEGAIMFPLYDQSAAIAGAPGLFMSPDAAARRMFYARTKRVCPVCGSTEDSKIEVDGAEVCDECGRPSPNTASPAPGLRDEIDQLIDDLDGLTGRG